jgi:glycosyltransferase involved in cell wall biosynthesis
MSDSHLRIGLDCRLAGKRHAGIGRYIENLLIELSQLTNQETELVYFFHDPEQLKPIKPKIADNKPIKFKFAPIRHYSLKEQTQWLKIVSQANLDLLHVPHFNIPLLYKGQLVVTIHDLLWHQQIGPAATTLPAWKYYLKYLAYRLVTRQAVKKANQIIVPAQTIKQTLGRYFNQVKNKTHVTKEGISQVFVKEYEQRTPLQHDHKTDSKQLIYVGSLYPHKNVDLILEALKQMPAYKLKIVSARNIFVKRFQHQVKDLKLTDQVEFAGYLSDQELVHELKNSLCLVQPSLSEGFGLTGVEAMACGCPVLASDIKIFQEIYQQAPLYFEPSEPNQLIQQIKAIQKPQTRTKAIKQGYQTVAQYNWTQMAQQTWKIYQQAISL